MSPGLDFDVLGDLDAQTVVTGEDLFDPLVLKVDFKKFLIEQGLTEAQSAAICEMVFDGKERLVAGFGGVRVDGLVSSWKNHFLSTGVLDAAALSQLTVFLESRALSRDVRQDVEEVVPTDPEKDGLSRFLKSKEWDGDEEALWMLFKGRGGDFYDEFVLNEVLALLDEWQSLSEFGALASGKRKVKALKKKITLDARKSLEADFNGAGELKDSLIEFLEERTGNKELQRVMFKEEEGFEEFLIGLQRDFTGQKKGLPPLKRSLVEDLLSNVVTLDVSSSAQGDFSIHIEMYRRKNYETDHMDRFVPLDPPTWERTFDSFQHCAFWVSNLAEAVSEGRASFTKGEQGVVWSGDCRVRSLFNTTSSWCGTTNSDPEDFDKSAAFLVDVLTGKQGRDIKVTLTGVEREWIEKWQSGQHDDLRKDLARAGININTVRGVSS